MVFFNYTEQYFLKRRQILEKQTIKTLPYLVQQVSSELQLQLTK